MRSIRIKTRRHLAEDASRRECLQGACLLAGLGTVYFTGQQLTIKSSAMIIENLDIDFAQQVVVNGTVKGDIKGTIQHLINGKSETVTPPVPEDQPLVAPPVQE